MTWFMVAGVKDVERAESRALGVREPDVLAGVLVEVLGGPLL
jgi:hypothetical protein